MVRDDLLTTPRVSRREFRWKPEAQRQITGTRCSFKHEKWRKNLGVTKEHLSYEMGFWNVEGLSAYAVISGTLTVTTKGQSVVRTGTLAYTFTNRDGV
jgi:hypothetical protein